MSSLRFASSFCFFTALGGSSQRCGSLISFSSDFTLSLFFSISKTLLHLEDFIDNFRYFIFYLHTIIILFLFSRKSPFQFFPKPSPSFSFFLFFLFFLFTLIFFRILPRNNNYIFPFSS